MRGVSANRASSFVSNDHNSVNKIVKTSLKSNELFAGRLLKQIDRAFLDLDCLSLTSLTYDKFSDLLWYLGYSGESLFNKDKILQDAWQHLGGSDDRNISKRSFIIFIYALNNLYFKWMSENPNS